MDKHIKYNHSEKGQNRYHRYDSSEKGRAREITKVYARYRKRLQDRIVTKAEKIAELERMLENV